MKSTDIDLLPNYSRFYQQTARRVMGPPGRCLPLKCYGDLITELVINKASERAVMQLIRARGSQSFDSEAHTGSKMSRHETDTAGEWCLSPIFTAVLLIIKRASNGCIWPAEAYMNSGGHDPNVCQRVCVSCSPCFEHQRSLASACFLWISPIRRAFRRIGGRDIGFGCY